MPAATSACLHPRVRVEARFAIAKPTRVLVCLQRVRNYEVLVTLEFTSARKRSSVVVMQCLPDGSEVICMVDWLSLQSWLRLAFVSGINAYMVVVVVVSVVVVRLSKAPRRERYVLDTLAPSHSPRQPEEVTVFCKGADSIIEPLLSKDNKQDEVKYPRTCCD